MMIAGVSDIHGMWKDLEYPKADVLVLAGDLLKNYSRERRIDALQQLKEISDLNDFLGSKKADGTYKEIVVVAGNHDFAFQLAPKEARVMSNVHYLQDSQVIIDGVKFWGSPWQPWFYNWAFNFPDHHANFAQARAHARGCWGMIPDDTDVLVTHGPPEGTLDDTVRGERVGCQFLRERIANLKQLKLHVFGHIHYSYGKRVVNGLSQNPTTYLNVAACNEAYKPLNPIQVVEIK